MYILLTLKGIDGSTEFKCDKRRSASVPDTAEITSFTFYTHEEFQHVRHLNASFLW